LAERILVASMHLLEQRITRTHPEDLLQPVALLGWPAMILALLLCAIGVAKNRVALAVLAGLLLLPIGAYLSATPGVPWGLGLPLACFVLAALLKLRLKLLGGLVLLLIMIGVGWLVWLFASAPN
jgi:hypothetical protein